MEFADPSLPEGAVSRPEGKIAIVRLPRDYDATLLFDDATRASILSFERDLNYREMELGLSCPDIIGIRLDPSNSPEFEAFSNKIDSFTVENIKLLDNAYKIIEGKVSGAGLLFAIALIGNGNNNFYQHLFEANVLKFLVQEILNGVVFRFNVHVGSAESSNVERHYKAASLYSLLRGGEPQRAVDRLHTSLSPLVTAQVALEDFPLYP